MSSQAVDSRSLFFSPQEEKSFRNVLKDVQEYISSKYSVLILDEGSEDVKQQIKRYISKYVMDYRIRVKGMDDAPTIEQELRNSRDVLSILENYKKNAGEALARELDIVCADMRSSSYEAALTRFEARLNSPQLSDIIRGLVGVLRGDDSTVYFQMLVHDFKQIEIQRLKAKAQKIPPKIRKYSFLMLMCFMATYILIIGFEILKSMASMF